MAPLAPPPRIRYWIYRDGKLEVWPFGVLHDEILFVRECSHRAKTIILSFTVQIKQNQLLLRYEYSTHKTHFRAKVFFDVSDRFMKNAFYSQEPIWKRRRFRVHFLLCTSTRRVSIMQSERKVATTITTSILWVQETSHVNTWAVVGADSHGINHLLDLCPIFCAWFNPWKFHIVQFEKDPLLNVNV